MASGSVIKYEGRRGTSWRIKYVDVDGRPKMETVREAAGLPEAKARKKAEQALGVALAKVEQGWRKPERRTFGDLCDEFEQVSLKARPLKKSTEDDYLGIIRNHLRPAFGHEQLGRLAQHPERFEQFAADMLAAGFSAKTTRNVLGLAGLMFRQAHKWRWVSENPLELVDPPRQDEHEAETLDAAEVARLLAAYETLSRDADDGERYWFDVARRMTIVGLSTAMRRGEMLGLRWQDVELLEQRLHVRQSFVRGEMTTPKSRAGRRTLPLGPQAVKALEEQYAASRYRAPESIVFCHDALGTPLDPSKLTSYVRKALTAAGINGGFRPWHGLRHTGLTAVAAAGVPAMYVQALAGHAQGSTTERYLHANRTAYPDAAGLAEARVFGTKEGEA